MGCVPSGGLCGSPSPLILPSHLYLGPVVCNLKSRTPAAQLRRRCSCPVCSRPICSRPICSRPICSRTGPCRAQIAANAAPPLPRSAANRYLASAVPTPTKPSRCASSSTAPPAAPSAGPSPPPPPPPQSHPPPPRAQSPHPRSSPPHPPLPSPSPFPPA